MANQPRVENIGFLVTDVARLMRSIFDVRVKDLGLTRSRWRVLAYLMRQDGMTQSELAEQLEISKASLGPHLESLEQQGWLRREADGKDRRAKRIYLTDRVQPAVAHLNAVGARLHHEALGGLDTAERQRLAETLAQVKANLMVLSESAAPVAFVASARRTRVPQERR